MQLRSGHVAGSAIGVGTTGKVGTAGFKPLFRIKGGAAQEAAQDARQIHRALGYGRGDFEIIVVKDEEFEVRARMSGDDDGEDVKKSKKSKKSTTLRSKTTEKQSPKNKMDTEDEDVDSVEMINASGSIANPALPSGQFIFFPKLPFEVRDAIWKLAAIPRPRLIKISHSPMAKVDEQDRLRVAQTDATGPDSQFNPFYWRARADAGPVPAILHTNTEARAVAKKRYNLEFSKQTGGRPVHVNFATDTITFLDNEMAVHAFYGKYQFEQLYGSVPESLPWIEVMEEIEGKIRHLAVNWRTSDSSDALQEVVGRFQALESLKVTGLPYSCECGQCTIDDECIEDYFPTEEWEEQALHEGRTFKMPKFELVQWSEFEARFK